MFLPLDDFAKLQCVELYPELISEETFNTLFKFSSLLPRSLTSPALIFEFICDEMEAGHTDFGFMLNLKTHSMPEIRAAFGSAIEASQSRLWTCFFNLLHAFERGELSASTLHYLWLVFDFNPSSKSTSRWPPDPNIYFFFKNDQDAYHAEAFMEFFSEQPLAFPIKRLFRRCLQNGAALNLGIGNIGVLPARSLDSMRIYLNGSTLPDQLGYYLSLCDYPHDISPLIKLLKILTSYFEKIQLGFDVSERIQDRIGVECFLKKQSVYERKQLWDLVLSELCAQKMLSHEKKEKLLNWMRIQMISSTQTSEEIPLVRNLNHIKLIYSGGGVVSAKAYLMSRLLDSTLDSTGINSTTV